MRPLPHPQDSLSSTATLQSMSNIAVHLGVRARTEPASSRALIWAHLRNRMDDHCEPAPMPMTPSGLLGDSLPFKRSALLKTRVREARGMPDVRQAPRASCGRPGGQSAWQQCADELHPTCVHRHQKPPHGSGDDSSTILRPPDPSPPALQHTPAL